MIDVCVEGLNVLALVDTGAAISVISEDVCKTLRKVRTPFHGTCLRGAGTNLIYPSALCTARVVIQDTCHHIEFVVLPNCTHSLILGWDFLSLNSAVIDCSHPELFLTTLDVCNTATDHSAKISVETDSVISPFTTHVLPLVSTTAYTTDVVVQPSSTFLARGIVVPHALIRFIDGKALIAVSNVSTESVLIPHGTVVVTATPHSPVSLCSISAPQTKSLLTQNCKTLSLHTTISQDLDESKKRQLLSLLEQNRKIFDIVSPALGQTHTTEHRIHIEDSAIVHRRPYRVSPSERSIIEDHVTDMLKKGVIRPSRSSFSSPVVLVKKKDGGIRFCIDYRQLNKVTRKDLYPMPRIDDALDSLQGAEYFSSLDLRSGYWQIPVNEEDKEKTAFVTPDGLYEFNVMPFGLCNAPATFERMIDNILRGLKWKTCLCYLDDIIIFSSNFEEHLERLSQVLSCLSAANLQLNTKKCTFAAKTIKILGHVISKHGIRPDPDKIKAVSDFPRPQRQKELRSFLGLSSYFRRFIRGFATIAAPLNNLLKNNSTFTWSPECESAFTSLKAALTSDPVLRHFNNNSATVLHTDASGYGLGAILLQPDDSCVEHVIAYASRSLSKPEQNYTITEKECLAVVWAIAKFRPYLYGRHFSVVTDHHALCWLASLKNLSGRLGRWALRLQEYDYTIVYKSGRKHQDADALSRCPLPQPSTITTILNIETSPSPTELFDGIGIATQQRQDPQLRNIIAQMEGTSPTTNARSRRQLLHYQLQNDILYRRNYSPHGHRWLLVIPRTLHALVLESLHDDPTAGHLGLFKTYCRVRERYFWPGMYTAVTKYVSSCLVCQKHKCRTSAPTGQLLPPRCPSQPFEIVGIDLFGPLPRTVNGKRWVVTAVDHLTRYAETAALPTGSATEVADFFVHQLLLRHGAPRVLLSDRGRTFLSQTVQEVLAACAVIHKTTSAYHPQTNGLTERFHRTLAHMIATYVSSDHTNWDAILPFVTYAYNTAIQSTTGYSPFELVHARQPTSLLDTVLEYTPTEPHTTLLDDLVSRAEDSRQLARLRTVQHQQERKTRHDSIHKNVSFQPGDLVLVSLPTRKPGLSEKLLPHYIGPYRVIAQTTPVNFLVEPVQTPTDRRYRSREQIHVSRLKPFTPRSTAPLPSLCGQVATFPQPGENCEGASA